MTNSSNLPAPYTGVNQTTPLAALQFPFCENLFNFNTTSAGIELRNGDASFANLSISNLSATIGLGKYGDTYLLAWAYDTATTEMKFYNVETGVLLYTSAAAGFGQFYPQYFNGYLFCFSPTAAYNPGVKFNVTGVQSAIGYTGTGLSLVGGGCVYKNRQYIVQTSEAAYWYSGIDAIAGALTKIDLSGQLRNYSTLGNIATLTLSDSEESEEIMAFCFNNGEILFYRGSYPDSADWRIAGKAKIGQLASIGNSAFPYQGDTIVLCDSGIVSLRELFLRGAQQALNLSINSRVQTTWTYLIKTWRTTSGVYNTGLSTAVSGIWDEINSRLYILLPISFTPFNAATFNATGNFLFVFDAIRESWSFHSSGTSAGSGNLPNFAAMRYYKTKKVVLLRQGTATGIKMIEKEGSSGFMDRNLNNSADLAFDYKYVSSPIPFPKTEVYETTQIEPIIESDLYAQTNWYLIADFGRQTTNAQTTDASTTAPAKPAVNVGLQNITFVQVQMSGTTVTGKTVGLTLYSFNVWYNRGEVGSR